MSYAIYPSLVDQTVVVTGGGTGIGAAIVEAFAQQGARVFFLDIAQTDSQALVEKLGDCAHRPALEELLAELRMERRRFVRRVPGPAGNETTLITQERLYLRNIPLTSWMEEVLVLGTGAELPTETVTPLIEPAQSQSLTVAS